MSLKKPRPLTFLQEKFVIEYMIDGDASNAGLRAGFSSKCYGRAVLSLPHVAAAIKKLRKKTATKLNITKDRVLQELAYIAFSDIINHVEQDPDRNIKIKDFKNMPSGSTRSIGSIEVSEDDRIIGTGPVHKKKTKIRFHDKNRALDALCKHLGIYLDSGTSQLDVADQMAAFIEAVKKRDMKK